VHSTDLWNWQFFPRALPVEDEANGKMRSDDNNSSRQTMNFYPKQASRGAAAGDSSKKYVS